MKKKLQRKKQCFLKKKDLHFESASGFLIVVPKKQLIVVVL